MCSNRPSGKRDRQGTSFLFTLWCLRMPEGFFIYCIFPESAVYYLCGFRFHPASPPVSFDTGDF
nr:MAG TPA: hypothetical protein [Caudoviricetes sp.]